MPFLQLTPLPRAYRYMETEGNPNMVPPVHLGKPLSLEIGNHYPRLYIGQKIMMRIHLDEEYSEGRYGNHYIPVRVMDKRGDRRLVVRNDETGDVHNIAPSLLMGVQGVDHKHSELFEYVSASAQGRKITRGRKKKKSKSGKSKTRH